jgi:excisionase family DNA binding protein
MEENNLEFFTVAEVSAKLQVHWQTVLNYIKDGRLNAIKIGNGYRISKQELLDFINRHSTKRTEL